MVKGELEIAIVWEFNRWATDSKLSLNKDMYVVSAIFMLVAVLLIVGNLVADLLLACWIPEYVMPP